MACIHFFASYSTPPRARSRPFGRPTLSGPQLVQVPHALVVALALTYERKKYSMAFAVDLAVLRATGAPLLATSNHGVLSLPRLLSRFLLSLTLTHPYQRSREAPVRYPRDNLPSIERESLSAD